MNQDFPDINGKTTFGLHFMLDAYGADQNRLDDMKLIFKFLNDTPDVIDMHKIGSPIVVNAEESKSGKDPGGITGFILIAESHIAIHTFPKRRYFSLDIYSCNNFEEKIDTLLNYIKETFGFEEHELQVVKRGLKYPDKNIV